MRGFLNISVACLVALVGGLALADGAPSTEAQELRGVKQAYRSILTARRQLAQAPQSGLEGSWPTWVAAAGTALELPPPPDASVTRGEIRTLEALARARSPETKAQIAYWDAGAPGYRWNEIAVSAGLRRGIALRAYRTLALLNVAIYDATVAAWDAKVRYHRPRPNELAPGLETALPNPHSSAYPSDHAVTAGAASTILAYLFPEDAEMFGALAEEAAASRVAAGVQYPSDVAAGLELGRTVAQKVIAWAEEDGSDAEWTGTLAAGPGKWQGEPLEPLMGNWRTWVLKDGAQLRPPPPPAPGSAQRATEVAEVRAYVAHRDENPVIEAFFWPTDPAGRPAPGSAPLSSSQVAFYYAPLNYLTWLPELNQKLFEYHLDADPLAAAHAYALVSVASYDAAVAAMDAKYHYLTARPYQFDPSITTVLPQYPIPSYPSLHTVIAGATSEVLATLFPADADVFRSRALELAESRLWAGIHFRSDNEVGLELGRGVAQLVLERDDKGTSLSAHPLKERRSPQARSSLE